MEGKPRCVFDTNALISAALLESSIPARAFRLGLECGQILFSSATIEELSEVLYRPKFDRYMTLGGRDEFFDAFVNRAILIELLEESGSRPYLRDRWRESYRDSEDGQRPHLPS